MIFPWKVRNFLFYFSSHCNGFILLIFSVELSLLVIFLFCWFMHLFSRHVSFNIQWKFICFYIPLSYPICIRSFIRIHSDIVSCYSFIYLLSLLFTFLLSCLANYYLVTGFLFIFLSFELFSHSIISLSCSHSSSCLAVLFRIYRFC